MIMKIFTVVGARPNFIKIDPDLPQTIIHTGQHYDFKMSKAFFTGLKLPEPKFNLRCQNNIGKMIDKLMVLFRQEKPDMVLVFGDTYSSLAGALAGAYCNITVAHVEAGLRSKRMDMPEEINRVMIDKIAKVKLCPNHEAEYNLHQEGINDDVYVVGDPMLDTFGRLLPIAKSKDIGTYILITLHRNFNADSPERLKQFFETIARMDEKFYFPVHPRTKKNIKAFGISVPKNIKLLPPQPYKQMIHLISNAKKVITDSGGVQREAFWMNIPVIILREETEWKEIITNGGGVLVGNDKGNLIDAVQNFKNRLSSVPAFGANKRIKEIIYKYL